jgi:hypothetical protein
MNTLALLNDWQRDFPARAQALRDDCRAVRCTRGRGDRRLRGGAARWPPEPHRRRVRRGAGGAAMLCAMAVPAERLAEVAALVSAHPASP